MMLYYALGIEAESPQPFCFSIRKKMTGTARTWSGKPARRERPTLRQAQGDEENKLNTKC